MVRDEDSTVRRGPWKHPNDMDEIEFLALIHDRLQAQHRVIELVDLQIDVVLPVGDTASWLPEHPS